jgi:hypothetical protein
LVDGGDGDSEELEANAFAVELLTGSADANYDLGTFAPASMVDLAREIGEREHVDPGVVILNHAFYRATGGKWGMVNRALKLLDSDANAPRLICEKMFKELDLTGLDEDQLEFLEKLSPPSSSALSQ